MATVSWIGTGRRSTLLGLLAVVALVLWPMTTLAAAPDVEAYRQLWNDSAVQEKIRENTERYRKADATVEIVDAQGKPLADATLCVEQQTHEFLFGCNIFVLGQLETPELNQKYEEGFVRLFNFATVPFYWRAIEPEPGRMRFDKNSEPIWRRPPPDPVVEFGKKHGLKLKGHPMVYVKRMFMPDWTADKSAAEVEALVKQHIDQLAERYGDSIPIWDVVNEELSRQASPKQWLPVPEDFLAKCFQKAAKVYPADSVLLINEGGRFTSQSQYPKYLKEITELRATGARCDGIGLQFHVFSEGALKSVLVGKAHKPQDLLAMYDAFGEFDLPLYITEITVPMPADWNDSEQLQALVTENYYRLWFSVPKMAGITWWNLGDKTAYKNENRLMGGLMNGDMEPKAAYRALDRLINEEWKTRLSGKTDESGRFNFRGFKGKYQLSVETPNGQKTFDIEVNDAGQPRRLVVR